MRLFGSRNVGRNLAAALALACLAASGKPALADHIWINEFHYDNASTDVNEFVEVVIRTPNASGFGPSDYAVEFYNGANGDLYDTTVTLDMFGTISVVTDGADTFTIYSQTVSGIQNGGSAATPSSDGLAVVNVTNNTVAEFLSYEGSFTADADAGGVAGAAGSASTDVGVTEPFALPVRGGTESIRLVGAGRAAADFTWSVQFGQTQGAANNGQTLMGEVAGGPTNDDFANRTVISGAMGTDTGTNVGATDEDGAGEVPSSCFVSSADGASVWWSWTAPSDGDVTFDTIGSDFDTLLTAWTGTGFPLTEVGCDDDGGGFPVSSLTFTATNSTEYHIRVTGHQSAMGNVTLNFSQAGTAAPDNDNFANRRLISTANGSDTGTNVNATPEMGESAPSCVSTSPETVWWGWTAPSNGTATFDTFDSDFDTVMDVFTGSSVDDLDLVGCNDDVVFRGGGPSLVTFNAMMGTEYQIRVTGFDDAGGKPARGIVSSGNITLNWTLLGGSPAGADCGPGGVGSTDGTSELAMWLRADSNVTESGGAVSAWGDRSGNGVMATQANGPQQPTLMASNAEENGNPTIQFNGTDGHMLLSADPLPDTTGGGGWTVFVLGQKNSALGSDCIIGSGSAFDYDAPTLETTGMGITHFHNQGGGGFVSGGTVVNSTATIMEWHRNGDDLELLLNGSTVVTASRPNERTVMPGTVIGGVPGNPSQSYDGTMGEFIIYDAPQGQAARRIIRNYLSARYDVIIGSSEDLYAGDDTENGTSFGDFDFEVAGIGLDFDGIAHPTACSGGLIVSNDTFLQDSGDYLLLGHDNSPNSLLTTGLPTGITQRFARSWYVDITDASGGGSRALGGNVVLTFDYPAAGIVGSPALDSYALLFSSSASGPFSVVANNGVPVGDQVIFDPVALDTLSNGFYTLGQGAAPLSVELNSFEATATTPFAPVKVTWSTSAEIDLVGFNLHRAVREAGSRAAWTLADEPVNPVAIPGRGNPSRGAEYLFTDSRPANGLESAYFLIDIDLSGRETIHGPAFVEIGRDPEPAVPAQAGPVQQEDVRQPAGTSNLPGSGLANGRLR